MSQIADPTSDSTPGAGRDDTSVLKRAKAWAQQVGEHPDLVLAWLAAALAFCGAVALIVVQLSGETSSPDSTTLGLFVLAAVLGFAVLAPRQAITGLKRITSFKVGGVELGLAEIKRAERVSPPQEEDGVRGNPRRGADYADCVKLLQERLESTRAMLDLKDVRRKSYMEIADALRRRGLLNHDEETFVRDLLQNYDPVSDDWSSATEEKFLDATWAFADRLRALVWDRRVRQQLDEDGWFIVEYEQRSGHRPDFLAYREGAWILVAARVGALKQGDREDMAKPARRLAAFAQGPPIKARLIVMPDVGRGELSEDASDEVRAAVELVSLRAISGADPERDLLIVEG